MWFTVGLFVVKLFITAGIAKICHVFHLVISPKNTYQITTKLAELIFKVLTVILPSLIYKDFNV